MKPRVYVTRPIPEPGIGLLKSMCDVTVLGQEGPTTRGKPEDNIIDADGILCLPGDTIDRTVMERSPGLKVISTFSVGFEHIDVAEATVRGIYVGYTPGILTDATADLAFALLLSAARKVPQGDRFMRSHQWKVAGSPASLFGTSVWGTTLGIVGLGRIGKAVAERAKGFGMRVLYTKRTPLSPEEEKELNLSYKPLESLFAESDFVSLHMPLAPETRHMINEKMLRLMKPSAILINTSRGATVDESALVRALQEGWIAGAALDVYEGEPINPHHALLGIENVVLVPHMGSATHQTRSKMAEVAALNLLAVLRGETPPCWLNPQVEKVRSLAAVKML